MSRFLTFCLTTLLSLTPLLAEDESPNILLIVSDDQG